MTDRAVILTGALGGIGKAISDTLSEAGFRVVGIDRKAGATVQFDLEEVLHNPGVLADLKAEVLDACKGAPLNALINNAAVQQLSRLEDLAIENWQATLNNNLTVPFLLSKLFLSELQASGGSIVNISSVHAVATKPGFLSYSTSKSALEGLTRALAVELGGRVRVNAIRPAAIRTPMLEAGFADNPKSREELDKMHPMGRIGNPSEVADVVKFLISDAASFMTGAVVGVDGGILSRLHDPA